MARSTSHNCLFCGEMFRADPRNARHQKYCSEPSCRKASKVASRRAWLAKPENQDYFRGPGVDLFSVSNVPVWIRALAWGGSLWKTVDSIDFSGLFRK